MQPRSEHSGSFLRFLALLAALVMSVSDATAASQEKQVAIVIDDLGNHRQDAAVLEIDAPLTIGILPHTPQASFIARTALAGDKEIILHIPMQAHSGKALGPGALTAEMNSETFQATLEKALTSLPQAAGVNNHMGSLLTEQHAPMQHLMNELAKRGLYFIDSRTTLATVAEYTAQQQGVRNYRRHVFLDNDRSSAQLDAQFDALIQHVNQYGSAIAIGHPYPETVALLKRRLPELAAHGIRLVPVSKLTPTPVRRNERPKTSDVLTPSATK